VSRVYPDGHVRGVLRQGAECRAADVWARVAVLPLCHRRLPHHQGVPSVQVLLTHWQGSIRSHSAGWVKNGTLLALGEWRAYRCGWCVCVSALQVQGGSDRDRGAQAAATQWAAGRQRHWPMMTAHKLQSQS
jgi:hypothetical protein